MSARSATNPPQSHLRSARGSPPDHPAARASQAAADVLHTGLPCLGFRSRTDKQGSGAQPTRSQFSSFQSWLHCCGGKVTSITVDGHRTDGCVLQLPCSKLTELKRLKTSCLWLWLFQQEAAAAISPDAGLLLPHLQHLELTAPYMHVLDFQQLSHLTGLTNLSLTRPELYEIDDNMDLVYAACGTIVSDLLHHLPNLVDLKLRTCGLSTEQLAPVSAMQHLQRLDMYMAGRQAAENVVQSRSLMVQPCSLTSLWLESPSNDWGMMFAPHNMPHCSRLTNLQQLYLHQVQLDAAVLTSWPQLQELNLLEVSIAGSASDAPLPPQPVSDGFWRTLLAAVGKMTQLSHLFLEELRAGTITNPSWLTALTASSHLTSLVLEGSAFLPAQAWLQHMLPPGKQLPHLQRLYLCNCFTDSNGGLNAAGISCIPECCPALQHLELHDVVSSSDAVSGLTQLQPGLTSLAVAGDVFDDAAAAVLAQLTCLKLLTVWENSFTLAGVQQLTALQGLTSLELNDLPLIESQASILTQQGDDGPAVHRQLLELCASIQTS